MNERILIVEDDTAISKLIDTNLTLSGYQTFCAMDGRQAVEVVQAQCFDLALCDIMLPELDGFELLPYMKEKGILGKPCPDYTDETVSMKVVRIIQGYVNVVNKMVWRKDQK